MHVTRHLLPIVTPLHRLLFRATRGWIGDRFFGMRCFLLEHRGRKSGVIRETPLLYVEHEGRYLVVGSNAGQDHPPAWSLNLYAEPRASDAEARQLWPLLDSAFSGFARYRAGTRRQIDIVILEPRAHESAERL